MDPQEFPGDVLLSASNLSKRFGETTVLDRVNAEVYKGDKIAIIGRSGSGKSTFLRCLNLLEVPTGGILAYEGQVIADATDPSGRVILPPKSEVLHHRSRVGMVFQRFELFPHLTALENVALAPRRVKGMAKEEALELARERLDRVGLLPRAEARPSQLSGGQQQRVAIARSLAMDPEMVLFDEPTSALDPELVDEVLSTMQDLAQTGITMIVVTHEIRFAVNVASKMLVFNEGQIVEEGTPDKIVGDPQSEATRSLLHAFHVGQ